MPETKYVFPGHTVFLDRAAKELGIPTDGTERNQAGRFPALHGLGSMIGQSAEQKGDVQQKIFAEALRYHDAVTLAYHAANAMVAEAKAAMFPAPPEDVQDEEAEEEWDIDDERDTHFRQVDPQPARRRKGK